MKLINKIIRKISGSELAQEQTGGVGEGKANTSLAPKLRQAAADGCVLLKNNDVLPFEKNETVAVFGRVQNDWFYVGNGSGGDVRAPYKINLIDGILAGGGFKLCDEVKNAYADWCGEKKNIPDPGFWGHWPRSYPEMPLDKALVARAAESSDAALVVIGRSAGEDRENALKRGSWYLTKEEKKMLDRVTESFDRVALILNIGSIMDFEEIEKYGDKIGAIMLVWQGGMESGNAVADVLSGRVNPSGRLSGTIAKKYDRYPGSDHFGNKEQNQYEEDIFVGYRYFETFEQEEVLYEFGFGLSYTDFEIKCASCRREGKKVFLSAEVTNTGERAGREVAEVYAECPQGKLGKAARVLVGFSKTRLLQPNESETLTFEIDDYTYASFDDSGKSGNPNCYVLEEGEYSFYIGKSVRNCEKAFSYVLEETHVLDRLSEVMAIEPQDVFHRFTAAEKDGKLVVRHETTPHRTVDLRKRIKENLPDGVEITGDRGYKLKDVKDGKVTMNDFVAQLSPDELELISRGEGMMSSKLGADGNAGVLGGVSQSLRDKGIPPMTATDGPSGIRLRSVCSLMPCGTALACTWDTELVQSVFDGMGAEMLEKGSDILLAPGMNIHRNPLCGRNFEYFSEDPFLTGKIAAAAVTGIQKNGVSACPKHLACNNQEYNRNYNNSVVSQRALREIYLKGFEICVKQAKPLNIMTSYNKINGVWSHYNYELCTVVLRQEWGYEGNVMTDWWMRYAPSPEFPEMSGNAYRVRAQVDVLMPGARTAVSKSAQPDGTLLETYGKPDGITLGEMQRTAKNVLNYIIRSGKEL